MDKLYITKSIEFRNYGTGRTGTTIRPVLFSGSHIQTYGEITSVPYEGGKWLCFKTPYLILQWHTNTNGTVITDSDGVVWGGEGNTMLDGIKWFKEQGVTFMTPLEYIEYLKNFN